MDAQYTPQRHLQTSPSVDGQSGKSQTFSPENLQAIIPLLSDGSNYDQWDESMKKCLRLADGAIEYLSPGSLPSWPLWQQHLANCVNEVLHRSTDPHLRTIIQGVSPYPSLRYDYLAQSFATMPFAKRLNKLDDLLMCRYDPKLDTINTFVSRMSDARRNLQRLGMSIGDDVFAGLLILGLPETFSVNTRRFEQAVRMNPQVPVDSYWVICALLEDEATIQRLTCTN